MRRLPSLGSGGSALGVAAPLAGVGVALLAVAALLLVAGASGADQPEGTAAGWESLLGDRPSAQLGGRWIVVLAKPSLASRVAAAGGVATEEQERAWTAAARAAQREVLDAARVQGGADRARARVLPGVQRVRDAARCPRARDRRSRSRREGGVPRARGNPGRGRSRQRRRPPRHRRRPATRRRHSRLLGRRGHGGVARHGRRSRAPVHPRRSDPGLRRARPGRRRERPAESDRAGEARAPRHRDGGPRRRLGGARRAPGRRSRCRPAADQGRGLAAGYLGRRLRLRPHRSASRRARARGRPQRGR